MASSYNGLPVPANGSGITYASGRYHVPERPIIPYIEGDGTGRDIWKASVRVFDAAVERAYRNKRRVVWYEVFAGEKAKAKFDNWLPDDTVNAIRNFRVAIKGPLTTPVGGGIRSLNVALRQILDLYACVRPVKYYKGTPSPVKRPELMDIVIYRENTEDVYAGIEWEQGTAEAAKLIDFLNKDMLKGGKKQIRQYWLKKSKNFQPTNHWVSETLAYKVRITVNGDRGTLYFECHYVDVKTGDLGPITAADMDVARIDGRWLITNMVGASARLSP